MVDKSEKFTWLVRLGYFTRGILYVVIGYLALMSSHRDKSQRGAMAYLHKMPGGTALLYLAASGLLAYALFKFCSLLFDIEHHGGRAKGLGIRLAHGGSGSSTWPWRERVPARQRSSASGGGRR